MSESRDNVCKRSCWKSRGRKGSDENGKVPHEGKLSHSGGDAKDLAWATP